MASQMSIVIGGSYNVLSELQDEEEDKTSPQPGQKRTSDSANLTPPQMDVRRKFTGSETSSAAQEDQKNTESSVQNTRTGSCESARIDKQVSGTSKNKRWSFKLKTNSTHGFDNPRTVMDALRQRSKEVTFKDGKLSWSKKILLLLVDSHKEAQVFNSLNKHIQEVADELKMELTIEFFNPRPERVDPTLCHVIIRRIPNFINVDDISDELDNVYEEGKIVQVRKVVSQLTKKPTNTVRIICADAGTASNIINQGILTCGVSLICEKALSSPQITRCFKCQGVGHIYRECKNEEKCGKCGESHLTWSCEVKDMDKWKCFNCEGTHAVWYHGCPNNKEHIQDLRKLEESGQTVKPQETIKEKSVTSKLVDSNISYAAMTRETEEPIVTTTSEQKIIESLTGRMVMMELSFKAQITSLTKELQELKEENLKKDMETIETIEHIIRTCPTECRADSAELTAVTELQQTLNLQIEDLTKEVQNLKKINLEMRKELNTNKVIEDLVRSNANQLTEVCTLTKYMSGKVSTIKDNQVDPEMNEEMTTDLKWITSLLCKATTEKNLKAVHEQRIKGSSFERNLKASNSRLSLDGSRQKTLTEKKTKS